MSTAESLARVGEADNESSIDPILPYGSMAEEYLRLGYSPLPLPPGKKFPPPEDYTGEHGKMATAEDVEAWIRDRPDWNIGLRLPDGVIGIDLDAYKGDAEYKACEDLHERFGSLPDDSPWCSSRDDELSGIQLFKVPAGYRAKDLGLAGEVIQQHHRYTVAPPSIHPDTGRRYEWKSGLVAVEDLPELPRTWLEGIQAGIKPDGTYESAYTKPDIPLLVREGISKGESQDVILRDVAWDLARVGVPRDYSYSVWQSIAEKTELERPGEPWTDADFERHYDRAVSKLSDERRAVGRQTAFGMDAMTAPRGTDSDAGSLTLTPLSAISFRRVEWAWDTTGDGEYEGSGGRFPIGTICIGAGRPGAGKGQFAAWLGARVSTGTLPGCFNGKPKGVIIYTTEDSHAMTIGPRCKAAGADLDRVFIFSRETEQIGGFTVVKIRDDLPELRRLIAEYDIGLFILDPLISVLDGKTDINSETAVRSELEPFQAMLEETHCFAFGIMHFRKMKDEDILNMFSGSGAFPRVVRAAVAFGAEKDDDGNVTRVLSTVKNNLGRTDLPSYVYDFESCMVKTDDGMSPVSKLVFTGEAAWSVEDINEGKNVTDTARTALDEAVAWLARLLNDGPKLVDDVRKSFEQMSKDAGFSWSTVERAKRKLRVQTRKDGFGGKSRWSLPTVDENDENDEIDEYGDSFSSSNTHSRQNHQKMYAREGDENGDIEASHTRQADPISSTDPRIRKLIEMGV